MAIKQDVNAPLILTVGIVSAILLLVIVFGVQAWFVWEEKTELAGKWEVSKNAQLDELRASQSARIASAGTIDVDNQKVRTIPIADAMQLVIQNGGKLPATQPKPATPK